MPGHGVDQIRYSIPGKGKDLADEFNMHIHPVLIKDYLTPTAFSLPGLGFSRNNHFSIGVARVVRAEPSTTPARLNK